MKKPLIGITMGDPCGIGPEIILKAISSAQFKDSADFLIIGSKEVLCKAAQKCNISLEFTSHTDCSLTINNPIFSIAIKSAIPNPQSQLAVGKNQLAVGSWQLAKTSWQLAVGSWQLAKKILNPKSQIPNPKSYLFPIDNFPSDKCFQCRPTPEGGNASIEYIFKGIELAMDGVIDALVTAPISKEAIKLGGYDYPGHTELLKERTNTKDVVMLMAGDRLRVAFVTSHVALRKVPEIISADRIVATIAITTRGLKRFFSIDDPRVAVCGLNPHSGEAGRFGSEEEEIIIPAVSRAKEMGICCDGPVPSDVVFFKARKGLYDVVIALYHDQGAIPIKLLAFETGVNITLGIPIIRTSPDHGTAYDIAGKGIANPGSMIEAIRYAIIMSNRNVKAEKCEL